MLIVMAGALVLSPIDVSAMWDESTAVHINAADIESSTLAIGTHLVHLSALNDAIYKVAEKSSEQSGQTKIYYKSELGDDCWFDITTATSLEDITTDGEPVTDSEINALFFTHHTKSDKITYDLRTGAAVDIFDIQDPYDLENMEELVPLKMYYDRLVESDGDKAIQDIWKTDVGSGDGGAGSGNTQGVTEAAKKLEALQAYLNVIEANGASARKTDKVSSVMEATDAKRRYEVFLIIDEALELYMSELNDSDEDTPSDLLSALAESIGNVKSALITQEGNMLTEGSTIISSAEYRFSNQLTEHAEAGNHAACDIDVDNLLTLDNIQNDVISNRPAELSMLDNILITDATAKYVRAVSSGESADYRAAVQNQSARALLKRLIEEGMAEADAKRSELEFLINAKSIRIDTKSAMDYIDGRLKLTTDNFTAGIPQDAFRETAVKSVETHIEFLTQLRRELELALGGNEMDKLVIEKEDLQKKLMSALDNNDLLTAKEVKKQIDAKDVQIRGIENESAAQISDLQKQMQTMADGSAEKAAAQAKLSQLQSQMSDGSLGSSISQLKAAALDGDSSSIYALNGMLDTAPELVLPALQDIYNDLKLNGGDANTISSIEQAILSNPNALLEDKNAADLSGIVNGWLNEKDSAAAAERFGNAGGSNLAGSGNDIGAGVGAGAAGNAASATDSALAGGTLAGSQDTFGAGEAAGKHKAAAALGLKLYYDQSGSKDVLPMISALLQQLKNADNPLVFDRIDDGSGEYLPLTAIEALTGRRYIWNEKASLGVIAKGSDYYGFSINSDMVIRDRDGEKTQVMPRTAKNKSGIHIPEEYTKKEFGVEALYPPDTALGVIYDNEITQLAVELLSQFSGG